MKAELHDFIVDFLDRHKILTLATNRPDGWPQATTVSYVNDGLVLFAFIARLGQKYRNIQHDPRLSIAIAGEFTHTDQIRGLSMAARAEFVSDRREFDHVWEIFLKGHPEFNSFGHPNPAMAPLVRMVPEWISVVDYTNVFGHSELAKVSRQDLGVRSSVV
jgi:nitroimidazol reductase NimA-like FMN-containing flavoprotein (pyridoxamine 5'-phosphate oxidase superfamily)